MDKRQTEVYLDGEWKPTKMRELSPGDLFRLFKPTGEAVKDDEDNTEWYVSEEPFMADNGRWVVGAISKEDWEIFLDSIYPNTEGD